ncbi:1-deoxy-D-xylulose-5-phosphate reductoisomerase [Hellea balneolensis]|uniref:1-deoxy-D-xylulose-5-phosphate reductoisomerase n=1 Tax=Hellea balneolensis TaxID=287478 RepID=UPI00041AAA2F|nr:1-deoxy-D-xylulose-5-phosphate reductoisomerase [Hellea balneolensis]
MTKRVTILGSTGSIGESTLDLVRRAKPGDIKIVSLTANSNAKKLAAQAIEFNAEYVALANHKNANVLQEALSGTAIEVGVGPEALIEAATRAADFCMAAIIGAAGLEPTLAAVDQGIHLGLANKECLVCAGDLFMERVKAKGTTLLPVDSEHNAIFQVLESDKPEGVRRLILTASGGPFREASIETLKKVTREDALNHPVWSMGAKISIDSATLMNKGLELIEASYLFDRPSSEIDILVHPQSIIHSMVEYIDGSILAQLGSPDMRTPIAYAMGWPDRMAAPVERLDLTKISGLTFFEPDTQKFPSLRLAREALEAGGKAPCVLNAANEIAVAAFLKEQVKFLDIPRIVETALDQHAKQSCFSRSPCDVAEIISTDNEARITAHEHIVSL